MQQLHLDTFEVFDARETCPFTTMTLPQDWILNVAWKLEQYLPLHHIPVRRLCNYFVYNRWNTQMKGRSLCISYDDGRAIPYLLQNSLLDGDALPRPTKEQVEARLEMVKVRFKQAEDELTRRDLQDPEMGDSNGASGACDGGSDTEEYLFAQVG